MDIRLGVVVAVFPLIFFAELPDKTMFASLVMGSRGRPLAVWIGTALAFLVHVTIAVTIGVAIFRLLPHRLVDLIVAIMFGVGAYLAFAATEAGEEHEAEVAIASTKAHRVMLTAFVVIFLAEWGDLTQVVTANIAARYNAPLSVALGSLLALWSVSAIAIVSGQGLMRVMPGTVLRRVTGGVCVVFAIVALVEAIRG
jgi:putative Ca2+/H+ antiporter (TMEM165/GDT1 family)